MKLFMIVSRVPWPLDKGDKLRAYNQLKELSKHHEVHLCCLSDQQISKEAINELNKISSQLSIIKLNKFLIYWRLFRALFSSKPYQVHYFYQTDAAKEIDKIISTFKPDHLYCQMIRTSEYIKHYFQYKKTIDYMDCLSKGYQRRIEKSHFPIKYFIKSEYTRLSGYEHLIFDYFDYHTIISQQDKSYIFHNDSDKIVVIPNGIDKDYFSTKGSNRRYDLVFTGNMSYPPNIEAATILCDQILPLLKVKYPEIKLMIAGTNPPNSLQRKANDSITISGWLDDIRDAYDSAKIFVAPMWLGSGLQNKLLEAMSMGLPCVTTEMANNALGARPDIDIVIGNSVEAIATACDELLKDETKAKSIGRSGQNYVRSNFSWQGSTEKLMRLWNNVII